MSPTEALAYYGTGGAASLARRTTTAPRYVFTYDDFVTWGVAMDGRRARPRPGTGGKCLSDANGIIRIPNMGTNRYSLTVLPARRSREPGPLGADHARSRAATTGTSG